MSAEWIAIIGIIIVALIREASTLYSQRKQRKFQKEDDKDDIKDALIMFIKDRLDFLINQHLTAAWVSREKLDALEEKYEHYKKLGGNGKVERWMVEVRELPRFPSAAPDIENDEMFKVDQQKVISAKKPTVMVVDDDPNMLLEICSYLQQDYRLLAVKSPLRVEEMLHEHTPDLFIVDYIMPDLTGLDLVPIIRHFPALAQTPIIMLTGTADNDVMEEAEKLGIKAGIPKAFMARVPKVVAEYLAQ